MAQWPLYKRDHSMGYYRQAEVAFQYALADAFTLCDAYHCSLQAGTNPNRLFLWTGSNGPTGANVAAVVNEWDSLGPPERRLSMEDLSGAPAGSRRELEGLPEPAGQLHRQPAGRLHASIARRPLPTWRRRPARRR